MKYFKSKATFILSVVLLSLAVVGTTLALLIALVPAIRNLFFPANVSCAVEVTYDEESGKWNAIITNDGDVDAYVRVAIVPYLTGNSETIFWETPVYTLEPSKNGDIVNWIEFGDHNYYYFNGVLKKSASVELGAVTIDVTGSGDFDFKVEKLDVLAEAFQVGSEDALADAWGVTYADGAFAEAGVCTHEGTLVYANKDNEYHMYSCEACGFVYGFVRHNMTAKANDDGITHSGKCADCGYVTTDAPHTMTYTKIDGTTHTALCSMCKWTADEACSYTVEKIDGDYHRRACKCGAVYETEAHNFVYTYENVPDGKHAQVCSVCAYVKGTASHTPEITDKGDGVHHTSTCSACGYSIDIAHTLRNIMEDRDTHTSVCDNCGYTGESVAHNLSYTSRGDSDHLITCTDECGYTVSGDHKLTYTDNGDGKHTVTCTDNCGYTVTASHTKVYSSNGEAGHTITCQANCGYSEDEAHTAKYTSNGDAGHTVSCAKDGCDYGFTVEQHTLTYTTNAAQHVAKCDICGYTGAATAHSKEYAQNGSSGHTWTCSVCKKSVTEAHDGKSTCVCGYQENVTYQKQFSMLSEDMQPVLADNDGYVYEETVMFIDGVSTTKSLLYPVDRIIEVKYIDPNSGAVTNYTEGTHFTVSNGKITAIPSSGIKCMPAATYNNYTAGGESSDFAGGKYWGEGDAMIKWQVRITYKTSSTWTGASQTSYYNTKYANLIGKLKNGQDVTILFCGDSITWGANAAFNLGLNPSDGYSYSLQFTQALADLYGYKVKYINTNLYTNVNGGEQKPCVVPKTYTPDGRLSGGTITYINTAVGGWKSSDMTAQLDKYLCKWTTTYGCDLLVTAFGMNDTSGWGGVEPATTASNVTSIINHVKNYVSSGITQYPDAAVMIISTMIPNPTGGISVNAEGQLAALNGITGNWSNTAVVDMTSVSQSIYNQKGQLYADYSGNNVNHPNDFLHRIYAQTMLEALIGYENISNTSVVPSRDGTGNGTYEFNTAETYAGHPTVAPEDSAFNGLTGANWMACIDMIEGVTLSSANGNQAVRLNGAGGVFITLNASTTDDMTLAIKGWMVMGNGVGQNRIVFGLGAVDAIPSTWYSGNATMEDAGDLVVSTAAGQGVTGASSTNGRFTAYLDLTGCEGLKDTYVYVAMVSGDGSKIEPFLRIITTVPG